MSDDVVISFDSPADVWRVRRGDRAIEIPLQEMVDEYYRWRRELGHRYGTETEQWREHVEAFCRRRLETSVIT